MRKKRKLFSKLLIVVIAGYVVFTLVDQQKSLNQYSQNQEKLAAQIEEEKAYKEELSKQKENVTSLEFIEKMAREKLGMYYPNERVYIDREM